MVRCLDPFYTEGKFATKVSESLPRPLRVRSRGPRLRGGLSSCLFFVFLAPQELFKSFARHLSHLLAEGRSQGKGQGKREGGGKKDYGKGVGKTMSLSLCVQLKQRPKRSSRRSSAAWSAARARPTGSTSKGRKAAKPRRSTRNEDEVGTSSTSPPSVRGRAFLWLRGSQAAGQLDAGSAAGVLLFSGSLLLLLQVMSIIK